MDPLFKIWPVLFAVVVFFLIAGYWLFKIRRNGEWHVYTKPVFLPVPDEVRHFFVHHRHHTSAMRRYVNGKWEYRQPEPEEREDFDCVSDHK